MKTTIRQNLDPNRLARQQEVVRRWVGAGREGTLEATTGFGKTTSAMLAIENLQTFAPSAFRKGVMVVVPTLILYNQWTKRLKAWGFSGRVETVHAVSKQLPGSYQCGLLILDEIHQYAAPVFRLAFEAVDYQYILGLTATLPEEDDRRSVITSRAPVVDSVPLIECLENGWVAPFTVYNLPVVMSIEEDARYEELNRLYHKDFAVFDHDFRLAMSCVSDAERRKKLAKDRGWDPKRVDAAAFNWIRNTQQRKHLLYNLKTKHEMARDLVAMFPERLTVTFSQSIESAEMMRELIGERALAYHSQIRGGTFQGERLSATKRKEQILKRFASTHHRSITNVLCTAKAFDVGADIAHIDFGIVLSGTSKSLQALQRYGRTLRKVDGKRTIIVELYAVRRNGNSTQDLKWLRSRQKPIRDQVVWINDPAQIS